MRRPVNAALLAASTTLTRPWYVTARIRLAGLKKPRPPRSAGDVDREKDRATLAEAGPSKRAGIGHIARADVDTDRKQVARLDGIARDASDRGPASGELPRDLKTGPAGAADNAVEGHGWNAFFIDEQHLHPRQ